MRGGRISSVFIYDLPENTLCWSPQKHTKRSPAATCLHICVVNLICAQLVYINMSSTDSAVCMCSCLCVCKLFPELSVVTTSAAVFQNFYIIEQASFNSKYGLLCDTCVCVCVCVREREREKEGERERESDNKRITGTLLFVHIQDQISEMICSAKIHVFPFEFFSSRHRLVSSLVPSERTHSRWWWYSRLT